MATTTAASLPTDVATPTAPDFFHCNPLYGTGIKTDDCIIASATLPQGEDMIPFTIGSDDGIGFPMHRSHGTCYIVVELAGPVLPGIMRTIPNAIRALASTVISQCVLIRYNIGGFVTYGLEALVDHVVDRGTLETHDPDSDFPTSTAFLTLTVHSGPPNRLPSPGDTDPSVPFKIASELYKHAQEAEPGSDLKKFFQIDSGIWTLAGTLLTPGSTITWWKGLSLSWTSDEMAYECDASLGSPSDVDCSNIEWNQLGPTSLSPPSEVVSVGPGVVQFLHSNSCYLAISATISIVLSWPQIRDAVAVLMSMCIKNPGLSSAQGGRAYYSTSAKVGRRRKRQTQVNGLNALPHGVNITIFQQLEPWTNPANELKSCTWDAASSREPLSKCATS